MPKRRDHAIASMHDAGREVSQNFSGLENSMGLASAALTALAGAIAAGELFRSGDESRTLSGVPKLSSVSLLLLAASFPLLLRFVMRAQRGFQNLRRFNLVRDAALAFLHGDIDYDEFKTVESALVREWRAAHGYWFLLRENLRYGFYWIVTLPSLLITWAFVTAEGREARALAAGLLVLGVGFEVLAQIRYHSQYYVGLTSSQQGVVDKLLPLRAAPSGHVTNSRTDWAISSLALATSLAVFASFLALGLIVAGRY